HENRFFMEGEPQFSREFGEISASPLTREDLQRIIKLSLKVAIRNDLMAPPYSKVRLITLDQKNEHTMELGGGQKIGVPDELRKTPWIRLVKFSVCALPMLLFFYFYRYMLFFRSFRNSSIVFLFAAMLMIADGCASSRSGHKKKLKPGKPIPCPQKD